MPSEDMSRRWRAWLCFVRHVTVEELATTHPNGGAVVAARAALATVMLFVPVLVMYNAAECYFGDSLFLTWDWTAAKAQLDWGAKFVVGGFGAFYAGLYTRFSSQWTYLAGTYNEIKRSESAEKHCESALAAWKAGFVEDAVNLHLARKSSFAPTIRAWLNDSTVREAFVENTPNGEHLVKEIRRQVNLAIYMELMRLWGKAAADADAARQAQNEATETDY